VSLLSPSDFRTATLNEACTGFALTTNEASDNALTSAISRLTRRLNDLTGDQFESRTETLELSVWFPSDMLLLPKRCTSVTTVKTRYFDGTLTTQATTAWRLRSSLDSVGALAIGEFDSIDIIPYSSGLTGVLGNIWTWPEGPLTVQVVGQFGWLTPPVEATEALAELVWDHFKRQRGDLGRATSLNANGTTVNFVPQNEPGKVGIPNVDRFIETYRYNEFVGVI